MSTTGERPQRVETVLPAWTAQTQLGLAGDPALGFPAVTRALGQASAVPYLEFDAQQAATARFDAKGFQAVAVSVAGWWWSAPAMTASRVGRVATARFAHPFAVVAAVTDKHRAIIGSKPPGAWHGVPVFSAWVSEPCDVVESHHR